MNTSNSQDVFVQIFQKYGRNLERLNVKPVVLSMMRTVRRLMGGVMMLMEKFILKTKMYAQPRRGSVLLLKI
jgi:hypothetical protein